MYKKSKITDFGAVFIRSLIRVCTFIIAFSYTVILYAEPLLKVGVLYPEVREPYQSVFRGITEGISKYPEFEVYEYALSEDKDDPDSVKKWIDNSDLDFLIALGNRARRLVTPIRDDTPSLLGAVLLSRELIESDWAGIVLNPHPETLFNHLKHFSPGIRNVHVTYNKNNNEWLIELAKTYADLLGLQLLAHPVDDLKDSAQTFKSIINTADPKTDAIWILQDPSVVDRSTILPFVLKETWKYSLLVFSSSPEHVRRGALFSVLPDHKKSGQRLGMMIKQVVTNNSMDEVKLMPVKDTRLVANIRTFEHLGIKLSREDEARIDIVFPSR